MTWGLIPREQRPYKKKINPNKLTELCKTSLSTPSLTQKTTKERFSPAYSDPRGSVLFKAMAYLGRGGHGRYGAHRKKMRR